MPSNLHALCFDANDAPRLAQFWAGVLDRPMLDEPDGSVTLLPTDATSFRVRFVPSTEPKRGPNQMHFDLTSSSPEDQEDVVARALGRGARHIDIGQRPEEGHIVLADPEGNEFCVTEAGNNFLAGCGFLGALSSDGTQEVGYFWSRALDWPLVWDQDSETAIQSPQGGPKITWGGPPVAPKRGKNRLHFDLRPDGDQEDELERLRALGASRIDLGQEIVSWVVLAHPDGNEFCVMAPRD